MWHARGVPLAYRCDRVLGCTFVVGRGRITADEWHAHVDRMFGDPAFPAGPLMLVDLRAVDDVSDVSEAVVEDVGIRWNRLDARLPDMRVAVVPSVAWPQMSQLIEREFALPQLRATLFSSVSAACAWLGLSVADVKATVRQLRAGGQSSDAP